MKDYYEQVKRILNNWPATRDDDMLLYAVFLAENKCVSSSETFYKVMSTAKARKLPSYESVTRARRKVQEKEPDTRGARYKARQKEENEYHEYYRYN